MPGSMPTDAGGVRFPVTGASRAPIVTSHAQAVLASLPVPVRAAMVAWGAYQAIDSEGTHPQMIARAEALAAAALTELGIFLSRPGQ